MAKKLTSINKIFEENDKGNNKFWRYLGVSIDKINDYSEAGCNIIYRNLLKTLSLDELMEFEELLNIDADKLSKNEKIEKLCNVTIETKKEILILRDFLSRKKKSVVNYYNTVSNEFDIICVHSQIIQLKQLLDDSILHMIYIYTLHSWLNKGTGSIFSLSKNLSLKQVLSLPRDNDNHFVNELHKKSNKNNNYRVFSYTVQEDSKIIILLYRQVNDASIQDFDEPFRNKEVAPIMFNINIEEGLLEIKSKFKNEINWIKEYIEENYNTTLTEIQPELFEGYDPNMVKSAFLEGESPSEDEVQDFIVNKISFRSSPLINSPRMLFSLENGDVFPSVKDAYSKECIDLESIKDVESISVKSENVNRTIRSTILDKGNILFSLNDGGIEKEVMQQLEDDFFHKFGIPLNKLINNTKYMVGKADVTDYLMTLSDKRELDDNEIEILKKLKKDHIITEKTIHNVYCENKDCDYKSNFDQFITQCPSCGYTKIREERFEALETSVKSVLDYIRNLLLDYCDSTDWELRSDLTKTIFTKKYRFINLVNSNTDESFQILIHQGSMQNKFIEKINRSLTPTVIIFVGVLEKHLSKYNNDCIFPVNFGRIYSMTNPKNIFGKIYEAIEHRTKSYLSSVANKSFELLNKLPEPQNIGTDYSPSDFEDDVFNIIKDIFPNADKWGSQMTGKEVPEGLFTINYNVHGPTENKRQYVYSYDCKLNKNTKGYDLAKDEQRKAFDYVEMLNKIKHITMYSTNKQLSSHIFICNNFKENNFKTMTDYFYRKLPEGYDARPIFLPLDVLVYLHSEYRKNYNDINNSRNIFMEQMHEILITDKMVIEKSDIENIISISLDPDITEYKDMDTKKVKKGVLEIIKKRG